MHGHRVEKSKFTDELIGWMKRLGHTPRVIHKEVDMLIYEQNMSEMGIHPEKHTIISKVASLDCGDSTC